MNTKQAKKLRRYVNKDWSYSVKQIWKARPRFIPKFVWLWVMKRAFVKK